MFFLLTIFSKLKPAVIVSDFSHQSFGTVGFFHIGCPYCSSGNNVNMLGNVMIMNTCNLMLFCYRFTSSCLFVRRWRQSIDGLVVGALSRMFVALNLYCFMSVTSAEALLIFLLCVVYRMLQRKKPLLEIFIRIFCYIFINCSPVKSILGMLLLKEMHNKVIQHYSTSNNNNNRVYIVPYCHNFRGTTPVAVLPYHM